MSRERIETKTNSTSDLDQERHSNDQNIGYRGTESVRRGATFLLPHAIPMMSSSWTKHNTDIYYQLSMGTLLLKKVGTAKHLRHSQLCNSGEGAYL